MHVEHDRERSFAIGRSVNIELVLSPALAAIGDVPQHLDAVALGPRQRVEAPGGGGPAKGFVDERRTEATTEGGDGGDHGEGAC